MVDTHLRHRLVLLQSILLLWNNHHLLQLLGRQLGLRHHHDHHLLRLLRYLVRRTCSVCEKVHLILHDGVLACWHHDDLLRDLIHLVLHGEVLAFWRHDYLLWDLSRRHLDSDRKFPILSIESQDL